MSNKQNDGASSTLWAGFLLALTLLFIGLKLTNFISWSWLWVLSPIWVPSVAILFILVLVIVIAALFSGRDKK